jgi:hypothetical protein
VLLAVVGAVATAIGATIRFCFSFFHPSLLTPCLFLVLLSFYDFFAWLWAALILIFLWNKGTVFGPEFNLFDLLQA